MHIEKDADIPKWKPFVLLLIDVQKDFWTDEMSDSLPNYERKISQLLGFCRQAPIDIVHLRAEFRSNRSDWMARYKLLDHIPCVEGSEGAAVFPFANEAPGEKVIIKQTFDGFHNSELHSYLQQGNKRFILVAGLVTSVCVLLTAANAAQRGYLVSVVEDCCADETVAHAQTLQGYPFIFDRTTVDKIATDRDHWAADLDKLANG